MDNLDDAVLSAIKQGCTYLDQILKDPRVRAVLGIGITRMREIDNTLRRLKRARFITYAGSRLGWRIIIEKSLPAGIVDSTCE